MDKKVPVVGEFAQHFFKSNKQWLDLIVDKESVGGFVPAVQRLFGNAPKKGDMARFGVRNFVYHSHNEKLVSFLPKQWQEEFARTNGAWPGCQNWWAGQPFIIWAEIRTGDDGLSGYLKLDAEVGPISDYAVRKALIRAIVSAASSQNLARIQFPAGAMDKGRLYSKFLRENNVSIDSVRDTDQIERKLVALITDFDAEFELVANVLSQWPFSHLKSNESLPDKSHSD